MHGTLARGVHTIPDELDNCLLYIYAGSGTINDVCVQKNAVIRFDASDASKRQISLAADNSSGGISALLFAGKRLNEPIAWVRAMRVYRSGRLRGHRGIINQAGEVKRVK